MKFFFVFLFILGPFLIFSEAGLYLLHTTKLGTSEVLLYPEQNTSAPSIGASIHIGHLATSPNVGRGVVSAFLGPKGVLLVSLLEEASVIKLLGIELHQWRFEGGQCWYHLKDDAKLHQATRVLDKLDLGYFHVLSVPNDFGGSSSKIPFSLGEISVAFDNATQFDFSEHHNMLNGNSLNYSLVVKYVGNESNYEASITFKLLVCPLVCSMCSITLFVKVGCPTTKKLNVQFPRFLNDSEFYTLHANYRPPSHLGAAIHISPHIYNVDLSIPAVFLYSTDVMYKLCPDELPQSSGVRNTCNCSEELSISMDINHSDCIRKVYRYPFIAPFPLYYYISKESSDEYMENASSHWVSIDELNNRTDYSIELGESNVPEIQFLGSGLYHYNASLNSPENTFCQLSTQFIVYVEGSPLLKVEDVTIVVLTSTICGFVSVFVYLYYYKAKLVFPRTLQTAPAMRQSAQNIVTLAS